jgi:TetR/AcrR family transcriptional repressor of nem operon
MKQTRGRPKAFDEDEALSLAMNYFWEHGYDNTSLEHLLPAMGIKKSSFYHTFKSKEELFSRVLDLYRKEMLTQLTALKNDIGAKKALLMLATLTIDELKTTGKVRGCLMVNSGQECYQKYDDLSKQIVREHTYFYGLFTDFVEEAKSKGDIKSTLDSKKIAGRYLNAINGLVATIQSGADEEMITDIVESLADILS